MIIIDTFIIFALAKRKRDVAQLVARHVRDVEAAGSSPVISTQFRNALISRRFLFLLFFNRRNLVIDGLPVNSDVT